MSRRRGTAQGMLPLVLLSWMGQGAEPLPAAQTWDPGREWAVEEGFALAADAEGFELPTAMAFVPAPGPDPQDPLYFVTELNGTIKVVTNDRSVHVFATDFFQRLARAELPEIAGETGLGGICLDPAGGYVFATFAFQDSTGVLRNRIVRFTSVPGTFSLRPSERIDFDEAFAGAEAGISHQVGGCQVHDDHLYVGVGDGSQPARSRDTTSVLGKILRFTVDGAPVAANRFYRPADRLTRLERGRAFIWSWGFRNPFGLKMVDGTLFVADNGNHIDRFVRVQGGEDYLWDGTDLSIGARADVVFSPSIAPVQLEYVPDTAAAPAFDGLRGHFFVASSAQDRPGVLRVPYVRAEGAVAGPPRFLVRHRGPGTQIAAALAAGPDGLYFAPVLPDESGRTPILRVYADPDARAAVEPHPRALLDEYGCLGCHRLGQSGGSVGPRLDRDSLRARLADRLGSEEHRRLVAAANEFDREPFVSWRAERNAVLEIEGHEQRLRWITAKILEPRFESPVSEMPRMDVPRAEAERIAAFLLGPDEPDPGPAASFGRALARVRGWFPPGMSLRRLAMALGAGFAAGAVVTVALGRLVRGRRG